MKIITGYRGEPHITSQQDRNVNIGIFGSGTHIVNVGSKMAATIVSANEITIADGLLVAEGCTAEIERGTTESISIENGAQEMLRKDLIVARYTKTSGTGVEDMQLAYIAGTPAASAPALPSYNEGSIANGDTLVDFPIFTVNIDGITIESVTRLVGYAEVPSKSYVDALGTTLTNLINTTKNNLQSAINSLSSTLATVSNRVGTANLNTSAKNALAAINELLTKINTTNTSLSATNSNLNTQKGRIDTLVTKTNGIVSSNTYNIAANAKDYKQLAALGMYMIILNGATASNTVRGIYLVGVTSGNVLGIKAISAASIATVDDVGNGIVRVTNTGSVTLRYTLIRMY